MDRVKRIRIGNTIVFRFNVKTNGQDIPLSGRDLSVVLREPRHNNVDYLPFDVIDDNTIETRFEGIRQRYAGIHWFEVYENKGKSDQAVIDFAAVELVPNTAEADDTIDDGMTNQTIDLGVLSMVVGIKGRGIKNIITDETDVQGQVSSYTVILDDDSQVIIKVRNGLDGISLTQEELDAAHNATSDAKKAADLANTAAANADSAASDASKAKEDAKKATDAAITETGKAKDAASLANKAAEDAKKVTEESNAAVEESKKQNAKFNADQKQREEDFKLLLSSLTTTFNNTQQSQSNRYEGMITAMSDGYSSMISGLSGSFANSMSGWENKVKELQDDYTTQEQQRWIKFYAEEVNRSDTFRGQVNSHGTEFRNLMTYFGTTFTEAEAEREKKVNDAVDEFDKLKPEVNNAIKSAEDAAKAANDKVTEVNTKVNNKLTEVDTKVGNKLTEVDTKVVGKFVEIDNTLDDKVSVAVETAIVTIREELLGINTTLENVLYGND